MDKKAKIIIIGIVIVVLIMLIINANKNKNTNENVAENVLEKDPNIATFIDEDTGYYVVYNEATGEEISRVQTKEEVEYYETHQNELEEKTIDEDLEY
jgi:hypothetical protein